MQSRAKAKAKAQVAAAALRFAEISAGWIGAAQRIAFNAVFLAVSYQAEQAVYAQRPGARFPRYQRKV